MSNVLLITSSPRGKTSHSFLAFLEITGIEGVALGEDATERALAQAEARTKEVDGVR